MTYIYLHGFASSPQSLKAAYLCDRFASLGLTLQAPDLNQNDFSHLTLTRQLQQVETSFSLASVEKTETVTVIGSSFGGLTAAWLAQRQPSIEQIVLLAPAFQFMSHWLPKLGEQQLAQWQAEGYLSVYHYSEKAYLPLSYQFVVDMAEYEDTALMRPIPTLIFHGRQDEVIPIQASRDFAAKRPWVQLIELEDDHALANVLPEIWQGIQEACQLKDLQFN